MIITFSFQIINELNKLNNGETIKCISFKCKKIFDDPFKFFHHSTVCKPLYLCSTCTESFNGYRLYISHPCMDTEEEDTDVVVCVFWTPDPTQSRSDRSCNLFDPLTSEVGPMNSLSCLHTYRMGGHAVGPGRPCRLVPGGPLSVKSMNCS